MGISIRQFHNKHAHERCFILGNGPSLNDIDLANLDGTTFGTNRIYLSGFLPDYYVSVNDLVLEQWAQDIKDIPRIKFVKDTEFTKKTFDRFNTIFLKSMPVPGFYLAPEVWEGHTVTYVCMQLAYYMGFSEVILLGVDHDFGEIDIPNQEEERIGPDQNHFHADYFPEGMKWNKPDLQMSEIAYSMAKNTFEEDDRVIYNASTKTKLDVFDLVPYSRVTAIDKGGYSWGTYIPEVSAIVSAYHCEEYLQQCLEDLQRQKMMVETIVVCQRRSPEAGIAFRFSVSEHRYPVRIVLTEDVPTIYDAWNQGIKVAVGKYITNANADDRHHPEAFNIMCEILNANPKIDLVYHDSYITWKKNQTFDEFMTEYDGVELKPGREHPGEPSYFAWPDYTKSELARGCFIGPHPMWRASLHQKYGYFIDTFKSAGDYEFWLRIAKQDNFFHIPMFLGLYLSREDGVELRDPITSAKESSEAVVLNQSPNFAMNVFPNHVMLDIDGNYGLMERGALQLVLEKVLEKEND